MLDLGVECHEGQGGRGMWLNIEERMEDNDFVVFVGGALSTMSSSFYRPLFHRVVSTTHRTTKKKKKRVLICPHCY